MNKTQYKYTQDETIYFFQNFAVMDKPISYKCFFVIAIKRVYQIWNIDLINAFFMDFWMKIFISKA